MRWWLIATVFLHAACTPLGSHNDGRSFEELFDQAVSRFCLEQSESVCRENGLELLRDIEDSSGIERGAILRHMVDTLNPDNLDNGDVPKMAYAILEAWRQLSFHLR